jgi:translation elongation factor EF-G
MTDPFVGSLTFVRVYSGVLTERHRRAELDEGPQRSVSAACC